VCSKTLESGYLLGPPLFDTEIRQRIASESIIRDPSDLIYLGLKRQFAPKSLTLQAEEVNQPWCDELLKRPASSEPSTLLKGLFPCPLVIRPSVRLGDICQVDVAARYILILPKHGIDRRAKLNCILLIDTAGVYPEVFKPIYCGLLRTELYLPPPSLLHSLALVFALLQVLIDDLLFSPGMREYCVGRDIVARRFAKDDLAVGFALQEA
jgi:hypothetical protein